MLTATEDKFLAWFSCHNDYFRFRLQELASIIPGGKILSSHLPGIAAYPSPGSSIKSIVEYASRGTEAATTLGDDDCIFCPFQLPSEDVAKIALARAVLLKGIIQVFASGKDYSDLLNTLACPIAGPESPCPLDSQEHFICKDECPRHRLRNWICPSKTFAFRIETFGNNLSQDERLERMSLLSPLFTKKEVAHLTDPDVTLVLLEQWTRPAQTESPVRRQLHFGRSLAHRSTTENVWWWRYRLTVRPVLGPTTMDTELSFLMANQAQLQPGMVVVDPFCGTGGLLIAAAVHGCHCIGSDIDVRVLKGYGVSRVNERVEDFVGKDVFRNFDNYGLVRPDFIRCDIKALCRRATPVVNAILADPPYGIRATVRESGGLGLTKTAAVDAVVKDLLILASQNLVDEGKLIFLFPCDCERYEEALYLLMESATPLKLKLDAASQQTLVAGKCRILVTMTRIKRNR